MKRALPPKYLSVESFNDCLVQHSLGTSTHLCFPLTKLDACSAASWQELANLYSGASAPPEKQLTGLPPAYLSIPGHQDCLQIQSPPGASHTEYCLPQTKPENCVQGSWDDLQDAFQGNACEDERDEIILGGLDSITPAYLSVPNFQDCLNIQYQESHEEYCIPEKKPYNCHDDSWSQLTNVFQGDCAPQGFQDVAGYDLCLVPDQGSPFGWCKPNSKPDECLQESWQELASKFEGEHCRPEKIQISQDLGATPPSYLVYPDYKDCLSTHEFSSHQELCLPRSKPAGCKVSTWINIRKVFEGIGCPNAGMPGSNGGAPAYLSVPNFEQCLGSHQASPSHQERCLPPSRPQECVQGSWDDLQDVFVGVTCPPVKIALNDGVAYGLPPAWLNIPGHRSCLEVFEGSDNHQEWCLPSAKPEQCSQDTWEEVSEKFDGKDCPAKKHIFLPVVAEGDDYGDFQTVLASKPEYLKVPDYELCLQVYQVGASALSEYCIPREKPENCPDQSWMQLKRVFKGIGCGPSTKSSVETKGVLGVGAPAYLRVPAFRDCLGDHPSPSGSYSELCLPASKPEICPGPSWENLQDPDTFKGIRCALNNKKHGVPEHLLVPNFQDCLSSKNSEWCLPDERPDICSWGSWDDLLDVFEGDYCSEIATESGLNQRIAYGQASVPGATPPNYLFIPNLNECLGIDSTSQAHTVRCLPKEKPANCPDRPWKDFLAEFDGLPCPDESGVKSISHIRGYEKCVRQQTDSKEKCVQLDAGADCEEAVHQEILEVVFKKASSSRIIFPKISKNKNEGKFETAGSGKG